MKIKYNSIKSALLNVRIIKMLGIVIMVDERE